MKKIILANAFLVACGPFLQAATVIDFESPYTTGALSGASGTTTDRVFTGQQGWSTSTGNSVGNIINTTTSGNYTGGQALTGGTGGTADTYLGAKAVGGFTSYTFDFRYYADREVTVGGWNDDDADGRFDQSETEVMAGALFTGGNTRFGVRYANFGTYIQTTTAGVDGNWYRMTVTTEYDATPTVTLGVFNLTTNSAVTLSQSSFTMTGAQFGVDPTTYEGVMARVTSSSTTQAAIDNITLIPEPSIALLGSLGVFGLLRRRR
jgi:hypothetical protein